MSSSTPSPSHRCIMCNAPAPLKCGSCVSLWYCSKPCQKADWGVHKLLCSQLRDFPLSARPSARMRRAILFRESSPVVTFIWAPVSQDHLVPDLETPDLSQWGVVDHSNPDPWIKPKSTNYNHVRKRRMPALLDIRHIENSGGEPNQGVLKVTKGSPGRMWMGPLVVMRTKQTRRSEMIGGIDPELFSDVEMQDLREAADFFAYCTSYEDEMHLVPSFVKDPVAWIGP